jgi:hemerythrin-like domain-containing protein
MGIQIGAKPDSGFDDPIGMLTDCHRRIERFLHILCLVAERARGRALTAEETEAVEAALHYFQEGGRRHNADEEDSLFPRLRAETAEDDWRQVAALVSDHRHADELHAAVEALYRAWIAAGRLTAEEEAKILAATNQLRQLYEAHIRTEEEIVFPRAARLLDRSAVAAIGQEFRTRRE